MIHCSLNDRFKKDKLFNRILFPSKAVCYLLKFLMKITFVATYLTVIPRDKLCVISSSKFRKFKLETRKYTYCRFFQTS